MSLFVIVSRYLELNSENSWKIVDFVDNSCYFTVFHGKSARKCQLEEFLFLSKNKKRKTTKKEEMVTHVLQSWKCLPQGVKWGGGPKKYLTPISTSWPPMKKILPPSEKSLKGRGQGGWPPWKYADNHKKLRKMNIKNEKTGNKDKNTRGQLFFKFGSKIFSESPSLRKFLRDFRLTLYEWKQMGGQKKWNFKEI